MITIQIGVIYRGVAAIISGALKWSLLVILVVGCSAESNKDGAGDSVGGVSNSIETSTERGPVSLVLRVSPEKPRLSDEILLTLTIKASSAVNLEKPPFVSSFDDFMVLDFHEPLPVTADDGEIRSQTYTLEPLRAGRLTIPPMAVRFQDVVKNANSDDIEAHTVRTEPLEIEVTTMLAGEAPSLQDLRPAADPVELPENPSRVLIQAIGAIVFGMAALVWWFRRRQTKAVMVPQLSPQQLARRELQQLIDQRQLQIDVKIFYVELTAIVRRFIEGTTSIRAPEQTTEEFLREIVGNDIFTAEEKIRLRGFLESADLVKFAGMTPDDADIDASIVRAREFIDRQGEEDVHVIRQPTDAVGGSD
ncbi:MAG: BatD family protein [Planctomycetaceae bacterium]